ncbi:MAG: hypothetical protein N2C14_01035, partial [Planctomycetales bacterium]
MMTSPEQNSPQPLSPDIRLRLTQLSNRIRLYVFLEGLFLTIAFVGLSFWLSFLLDHEAELPRDGRVAVLVFFGAGLLIVLFRCILRRAFASFSDRDVAVLLERRFENLGDALLTSVELRDPTGFKSCDLDMLTSTQQDASRRAQDVSVWQVFRFTPLLVAFAGAFLLACTVSGFAQAAPDKFKVYVQRNLLLEDVAWPKMVTLTVVEPDALREESDLKVVKIANGDDLTARVQATLNRERFPDAKFPRAADVRYWSKTSGRSGSGSMVQEGEPDGDDGLVYAYTFRGLLKDEYEFQIDCGDGRLRGLQIHVVDSPVTHDMTLHCVYPDYTRLSPADLPVSGAMRLPFGTQVTLRAKSKKPLVKVDVRFEDLNGKGEDRPADLIGEHRFTIDFPMDQLQNLAITLHDADGIHSREPERVSIDVIEDEAPIVALVTQGVSGAVTPRARIPFVGQVTDDHGLQKTWFEFVIEGEDLKKRAMERDALDLTEMQVDEPFEVRDLAVKAGQKLTLQVKAQDEYPLGENNIPHTGMSERFFFDVVTPDELREILEFRELNLRQRFEQIIEEVVASRKMVESLIQEPVEKKSPDDRNAETSDKKETPDAAAEQPVEETVRENKMDRLLGVQRAWQNRRKNANETLRVSTAFDEIVQELNNNRIETDELVHRLLDDI